MTVHMPVDYAALQKRLTGLNVLMTTPFTRNKDLNVDELRAKTRFLLESGLTEENGTLIVLGSVGECGTLTREEQRSAVTAVVDEADGTVPVVAGANHSGTRVATDLANSALNAGADAVMSVTPYYYPPSSDAVVDHYETLTDGVDGGIVLYNNFVVSDLDIPLTAIERLAKQDAVVGIKEPTLDTAKLDRVVATVGDRLTVLNGNGEPFEPQASLLGSEGFTSAMANYVPEFSLEIHRLSRERRYAALRDRCRECVSPIATALRTLSPESSPAALKYLEEQFGVPGGGPVRSPHPSLTAEQRARLDEAIEASELGAA